MNRLENPLDAVLHLLDRQLVDADGRLLGKVDEVELTEWPWPDGKLAVTALLTGPEVLVPRFGGGRGGALHRLWRALAPERSGRDKAWRIPLSQVDELTSEVRLRHSRDGLLEPEDDPPPGARRHRLDDLLRLRVEGPDGALLGHVLDVRLEPLRDAPERTLEVTGLVVGRGRPGSMLGYDRGAATGPWPVAKLVCLLHRHSGRLDWGDVTGIDWLGGAISARHGLRPLGQGVE